MITLHREHPATGGPGIPPRWTRSAKDAVGTAYAASARVWFTTSLGVLNEVYYPTVDRPQIRDLMYVVTDGESFFHDERRHLDSTLEYLDPHTLGVRITSSDRTGRYRIVKEVITDPHQPCVLLRTSISCVPELEGRLRLYSLLAPHLAVSGSGNSGYVAETAAGRRLFVACKGDTWLALAATVPFGHMSCGYVGTTDGWSDISDNLRMNWAFDSAENGNIALTGELDLSAGHEFTLGLAFGDTAHHAVATLIQALSVPFEAQRERYVTQWDRACDNITALDRVSGDRGRLYHLSHRLLLAHEDKSYPGAMIASLSIPWGEAKGDDDIGGYHLVWTRDMVQSAMGLLAADTHETPFRALIYLACSQQPDGSFPQNFWIDGTPYWRGIQLDEMAFPLMLAHRLEQLDALRDFDPYPMVLRAAGYLVARGPVTQQERWEENSGYSPSTIAAIIAGTLAAAAMARRRHDKASATLLKDYADFLESRLDGWTVTTTGSLLPDVPRHFIRVAPADVHDPDARARPDEAVLTLRNRPPQQDTDFPANRIVDAGFLELVRYGIRAPNDPLITDSLRVVDACLRVETPNGPCWRRYNFDGYGQREDGGPYRGWGQGRAWPLLTGERGHYELAAGRDARPYLRAMERFASASGLLPEQVWDEHDRPEFFMYFGRPTGSAMPLMWAHAEYIRLLRSVRDGMVFDRIPAVADRYLGRRKRRGIEYWSFARHAPSVTAGTVLRVTAQAPFRLRWSLDDWATAVDVDAVPTPTGIAYADLAVPASQRAPVRFTFYWPQADRWEGRNFEVPVERGKRR